jgi:microcystin-dependent protein
MRFFSSARTETMSSIIRRTFTAHHSVRPIVGDSKFSFTDLDHVGWLMCDGRSLPVADFITLFKVIGYTFGGSGSQFNLPDMRGRVPGAAGAGAIRDDANRILSSRSKGQYTGEEIHLLNINEMPSHKHGADNKTGNTDGTGATGSSTTGITVNDDAPSSGLVQRTGFNTATTMDDTSNELDLRNAADLVLTDPGHTHTIGSTGGGAVHNNMQPTLFVGNAFIYSGRVHYGYWPLKTGSDLI